MNETNRSLVKDKIYLGWQGETPPNCSIDERNLNDPFFKLAVHNGKRDTNFGKIN